MGAPSNLADQDHHVIRLTRIEDVLEEMSADLLLSASDWEAPNLLTFRPRRDCKSKHLVHLKLFPHHPAVFNTLVIIAARPSSGTIGNMHFGKAFVTAFDRAGTMFFNECAFILDSR